MEFSMPIKRFVDENAQRFIVPLIFLVLVVVMYLLPFNKLGSGYVEQQWFVNYSSGFLRRGLFGELAKWLNLNLSDIYLLFNFVNTILFTIFFTIVWRSFGYINSKNILYFLLVITSPIFYSALSKLNGRFDLIFTLSIFLLFLIKKNIYKIFVILISSVIFGLIHELWLILYIPLYLLLVEYGSSYIRFIVLLLINLIIIFFVYFFTSVPLPNVELVCNEITLSLNGLNSYVCKTSENIYFVSQTPSEAILNSIFFGRKITFLSALRSLMELLITIVYIMVAATPIFYVLKCGHILFRCRKKELFFICVLFLLICLIALDWGRFLIDILQVLFLYLIYTNKFEFKNELSVQKFILLFLLNILTINIVLTRIPI